MTWITFAILAHVANGAVFIVDKSLLGKNNAVGNPIQYALYSAALAGLALMLIPFTWPAYSSFVLAWSLVAGLVHIAALYVFFVAMRFGEPSRVVPITGSFVPLFTILFAYLFLGEAFTVPQFGGMGLLIAGGYLLSMRRSGGDGRRGLMLPLLAGALFAAYFAVTKYLYDNANDVFLGIFITTRAVESAIALLGIVVIHRGALIPVTRADSSSPRAGAKKRIPVLFIANKGLAAGAFLLQTYAISLGSVSVVNALQGVQFAFVFVMAIIFSRFFPKAFTEEVSRGALLQKFTGIVLVSIGVALLV